MSFDNSPAYSDPAQQALFERMCAALDRCIEADPVGAAVFAGKCRVLSAPVNVQRDVMEAE